MKKLFFTGMCLFLYLAGCAQQPHLKFMHPYRTTNTTSTSRNYISGNTCKNCQLTVNGQKVKVFPTGAFAVQLDLLPGDTLLQFKSTNSSGQATTKKLVYKYKEPTGPKEVTDFRIASVKTIPSRKSWLLPGDRLQLRIKAQPNNEILINNQFPAYEQAPALTGGVRGIYQYTHVLQKDDPLLKKQLRITMEDANKKTASYSLSPEIKVLDRNLPVIGKTTGAIPYLEFGKGTDRLGGAKMNYLDTAVLVHITGRFDDRYRVLLAPGHTAYIPVSQVALLSKGAFIPHYLSR